MDVLRVAGSAFRGGCSALEPGDIDAEAGPIVQNPSDTDRPPLSRDSRGATANRRLEGVVL